MEIPNSGIQSFMIVAKFLGIKTFNKEFDPRNSQKNTEIAIMSYAKEMNLKARLCRLKLKKLDSLSIPVIAKDKSGEFFLIVKKKEDSVMILRPDETKSSLITVEELLDIWEGTAILIANKRGNNASEMTTFGFRWFIPSILKFKKQFIQILLAVFAIQIIGIVTPVMTQVVVDKVLSHYSYATLYVIAIGIVVVYIYELIMSIAKNYLFAHTTNRIDVILSNRLFKHLFSLPLKYFEARRVGETVARVRELDTIRQFLTGTPLSTVIDLLFIVVYIVVLLFYSTKLTLIVLASIPIFAVISIIITPMFKKRLDEKFNTGAETQSFLVEAVNGIQTVKSFALEPVFINKWGDLQSDYVKAGYKTTMVSSNAGSIASFVQKVFDLLILFFGAQAVMDGTFTVGQLVAFRMLSGKVSGPVLRLVQLWQEYQQASLSVKRIGDIFNSPVEASSGTNVSMAPEICGRITFDKVRFRYKMDTSEVIKDMSFTIEEGKTIGIVGRSGSGKSTLSKLIQRLYIPEGGKINIDGMDISLVNPAELRKHIGVVLQENFMFNGTVSENIAIHFPAATPEQIVASAKIAGAHDFILELPNGYDTMIGEKGIALSGGQKQRVAIARAIIGDPKILIFDEATSALDYESESIIQKNLKEICRGRTVLIIAHRLSTLKDAEKIMVIDRGNLVEYDSHESLLSAQGLYYHLFNQQQRGETE